MSRWMPKRHSLIEEPSEEDKIKSQIDLYRTQARNLRADAEEREKRADELHRLLRGKS